MLVIKSFMISATEQARYVQMVKLLQLTILLSEYPDNKNKQHVNPEKNPRNNHQNTCCKPERMVEDNQNRPDTAIENLIPA
jgi:hypothetical protein